MTATIPTAQLNGHKPKVTTTEPVTEPVTGEPSPGKSRLRRNRRSSLVLVAASVVCGLIAWFLISTVGNTRAVLVLANDVHRGAMIESSDLTVAQIGGDPALQPVDASMASTIVGQRAQMDLAAGSILTQHSVADSVTPAAGMSLVGLKLTSGQLPSETLIAGDSVQVITTPRAQDDVPATAPSSMTATVHQVVTLEDGSTRVDVLVPAANAASLAQRAATERIALILDSRESSGSTPQSAAVPPASQGAPAPAGN